MTDIAQSGPRGMPPAAGTNVEKLLLALVALAAAHALFVLWSGLDRPPVDLHAFRQTQTALTAYWILQGGPWLAYETPVLGAPWSIPFEFPLYQLLVAGLSTTGLPLDVSARLLGYLFFFGSLAPIRMLFRDLDLGQAAGRATAILFLASPLYLYWSRAFLVESCALFFSLLWLALTVRFLATSSLWTAGAALNAGTLAVLAKSTTFPAFAALGSIAVVWAIISAGRNCARPRSSRAWLAATAALITLVPIAVGVAWVRYTDQVKAANEFARSLTSTALTEWNLGTLEQKLSAELWLEVVLQRVAPNALGVFCLAGIVALGAALTSVRHAPLAAAALLGFAIPFAVFTNLHLAHDYYAVANAVLLIVAVGIGLGRLIDSGSSVVSLTCLLILVGGQLRHFHDHYAPELASNLGQHRNVVLAAATREAVPPGQGIVVLGQDWSSEMAYLAERKAVTISRFVPRPLLDRLLADPQPFLGDQPFGAVVVCLDQIGDYGANAPAIEAFIAGRPVLREQGPCRVLGPTRGT